MHSTKQEEAEGHSMGAKVAQKTSVHTILAQSYTIYFLALLFGIFFDFLFPRKLFEQSTLVPVGAVIIVLSTCLIFWAQTTSRNLKKETLTKESFCSGPYCFTRIPTHLGLFLLMLGFGLVMNATFIILFTVLSFLVTKLIFTKMEEVMLADKYGAPYLEYKKSVRF